VAIASNETTSTLEGKWTKGTAAARPIIRTQMLHQTGHGTSPYLKMGANKPVSVTDGALYLVQSFRIGPARLVHQQHSAVATVASEAKQRKAAAVSGTAVGARLDGAHASTNSSMDSVIGMSSANPCR
jgi:hypothetical protein